MPRKQKTQPKKGKPVEIPVPKRGDIDRLLKRAAKDRKKPLKETRGPPKRTPRRKLCGTKTRPHVSFRRPED